MKEGTKMALSGLGGAALAIGGIALLGLFLIRNAAVEFFTCPQCGSHNLSCTRPLEGDNTWTCICNDCNNEFELTL